MSDEDDYMSDTFLVKLNTVPPGLKPCSSSKSKAIGIAKNPIKGHVLEKLYRNQGLEKMISSENKGYRMLLKMGYKPGKGLGKDESGIVEPIPIDLKNDKGCLGEKTMLNAKVQLNKRLYNHFTVNYQNNMKRQFEEKSTQNNLYKIQRICRDLDMNRGLGVPMKDWYWPVCNEKKSNYDKEIDEYLGIEDEVSPEVQLLSIHEYLRKMFSYCYWCGCKYTDESDLMANCPGFLKDDHE